MRLALPHISIWYVVDVLEDVLMVFELRESSIVVGDVIGGSVDVSWILYGSYMGAYMDP